MYVCTALRELYHLNKRNGRSNSTGTCGGNKIAGRGNFSNPWRHWRKYSWSLRKKYERVQEFSCEQPIPHLPK